MSNIAMLAAGLPGYPVSGGLGPVTRPATHRSVADTRWRLLARYLEGWAEADPLKIAVGAAPGYRFDDPLVGRYSALTLPRYFGELGSRTGMKPLVGREQLSFVLSGPMDTKLGHGEVQFWREAPRLGLTGTSLITLGPNGVNFDRVAYDLNIATEQLRRPS